MLYDLYEPLPELRPYVAAFWAQEKPSASFASQILLPDSYFELIVALGPSPMWELESGERINVPSANIVRVQREPIRVRAMQDFRAIGIHLHAWGAHPLIGKQISFDMPCIPLDAAWQQFALELDWVVQRHGYAPAIACLQQFVADIYRRTSLDLTPVRNAGTLLQASHGQLGIYDLADQCYISPSQLQRQFKEYVGLSPKTYARIIRFEAVRDRLLTDPSYPTLDLVNEFGYADQAHFIRDFKTFTTQTPREFATYAALRAEYRQDAAFLQSI